MGFGILFFGYLLLAALPCQELTNVAAAAVMMLAFYKLSYLNAHLKRALYASVAFSIFSVADAVIYALEEFYIIGKDIIPLNTSMYMIRNMLIALLSIFMLFGLRDVADEVKLKKLAKKCDIYSKITLVVYVLNLTVPPDLSEFFGGTVQAVYAQFILSMVTVILTFFIIIMNSMNIFSCYAKICMPEENGRSDDAPKRSKFAFVEKFRQHEEEKRREYELYKIEKMKKSAEKRSGKRK